MLHYALSVVQDQCASKAARRRAKMACNHLGLSHNDHRTAVKAAVVLSGMAGVERVVMTRVREDNEGTWRDGSKS